MKIILGTDITDNRKNTVQDGKEFIAEKIPAELEEELKEKICALNQLSGKAELPLLPRVVRMICGYGAFIVLGVWIRGLLDGNNIMKDIPWLMYVTAAALAVWVALIVISQRRINDVYSSVECETVTKDYCDILQKCMDHLEMKDDEPIDVMQLKYKRKPDGSIKIVRMAQGISFNNCNTGAFCRNGCMCLASYIDRVDIPISEVTGIRKIDKRVCISDWNKDEKWNSGKYAQYNIKVASGGGFIIPCYYALCVSHSGEEYELYFAPYDLETVQRLTGVTEITE